VVRDAKRPGAAKSRGYTACDRNGNDIGRPWDAQRVAAAYCGADVVRDAKRPGAAKSRGYTACDRNGNDIGRRGRRPSRYGFAPECATLIRGLRRGGPNPTIEQGSTP